MTDQPEEKPSQSPVIEPSTLTATEPQPTPQEPVIHVEPDLGGTEYRSLPEEEIQRMTRSDSRQ